MGTETPERRVLFFIWEKRCKLQKGFPVFIHSIMFSVWYILDCNCWLAQLDSHFPADSLYKVYQVFNTHFFIHVFESWRWHVHISWLVKQDALFFRCIPRINSMHLGPTEMLWEFPGRFWWKTLAVCSSKHILQDLKKKHTIKLGKWWFAGQLSWNNHSSLI